MLSIDLSLTDACAYAITLHFRYIWTWSVHAYLLIDADASIFGFKAIKLRPCASFTVDAR